MSKKIVEIEEYFNKTTGEYQREKPAKHKDKFIRVPFAWINTAALLPGKAVETGLAAWYLSGLRKQRTIKLPNAILLEFGITRQQKYRALRQLQDAGLINVDVSSGKNPTVTLLELPQSANNGT